jgi:SAM-dependent methyltransferase
VNGYFKQSDPSIKELAGYQLPSDWWSRPWEYAWAIEHAVSYMTAADMGCGWMYRPFKDALAEVCKYVYAVDADQRLHEQEKADNMGFVIGDITKQIPAIPSGQLDRVFCISVLEDLGDMATPALKEFKRCLNDSGKIILTFDVPYLDAPTPVYPGLPLDKFEKAMIDAGLSYDGAIDYEKESAVNHQEWNLCVFHCVLIKQ